MRSPFYIVPRCLATESRQRRQATHDHKRGCSRRPPGYEQFNQKSDLVCLASLTNGSAELLLFCLYPILHPNRPSMPLASPNDCNLSDHVARLPWAHRTRLQQLLLLLLTTNVSNNSGNLLFAQSYPQLYENVGFVHSWCTVFGPQGNITNYFHLAQRWANSVQHI